MIEELCKYLSENFIDYKKIDEDVIKIDSHLYELFIPNEQGRFFDESFCWDCEKTDCDRYVFKFGGCWYWFNRGEESKPKLNRLKYIGKAKLNIPETQCPYFLGVHGPFELLNGCNSYKDWAKKAKFLGIQKLGICEKKTLAGLFKFQSACLSENISPILGMEIPVKNEEKDLFYTIKVFVENKDGWNSLLTLNKIMNVDNDGYISEQDLQSNNKGLVFILDPKTLSYENIPNDWRLKESERFYYQLDTVIYNKEDHDEWYLKNLKKFFISSFKPIAMFDAYYLDKEYAIVRSLLNRVAGVMNYESDNQYFKNGEEYFNELSQLFKDDIDRFLETYEEAIENLGIVARKCEFLIETGKRHLPKYSMTDEENMIYSSNKEMFEELVYKGLEDKVSLLDKYGDDKVIDRINQEITTIEYGELEDYFLILRDIINWAHSQGIITGRGRGSGAGSLVNYLLKLTDVDPLRYNLLFSRFLNEGRLWKEKEIEKNGEKIKIKVPGSLPDIDTDTPGEQRPRIKEYMEQRFGTSQVCSVGTYTTLQLKAALTDLSKLYNISIPTIRSISKKINGLDDKTIEDFFRVACKDGEVKSFVEKYPELINVISLVLGQPKASSIHACAMMIFPKEKAMYEWVPIHKQKARTTDTDMIVTDWEGSELDEAGFLKEDILGIEQLDKFADILALIKQHTGEEIDLSKIPLDDTKVFKYFKRGWLNDVFHFGAKGLSGYVVKVQPESIDDLGICAALYRPGPMENNFHNEFLLRRSGEREIDYPIGAEHILEKSYGLMCFQEDLIRMVQDLAGFTEAQGDEVRKCIDGDELFWTTEGAVKIKDLKFLPVKPKVTTLGKDFSVKYNSVNRSFSQGTKDCIRINIQGNSSLVCTPDHKILTEIGWLEAKDCVGHYVYKDLTRRYGTLKKPKEELYLMVALLTEGSLSKRNCCSFVNKDRREIDEFKRCYFEVFGVQLKEHLNSKTGCISLNVSSKNVEELGLKHVLSEFKELPDYVFSLDKDCQEFVIAKMIDFDGYIANKKGGFLFGYSSKSSSLIKQMEILFSCLGIVTTTNRRSFKDYPDNYFDIGSTDIVDCLKIKEAVERYSFKFKEFNFTLDDFDLETTSSYKIPFEIWQPIVSNLIDCSGYTCNELLGCNILNYGINHKINITKNRLNKILQRCGRSKFLETCIKGDFCFRLVESIESVGPREVYDFSMEYGCVPQAFVGGILVHNCIGKKLIDKIKTIEPRFVEGYVENFRSQGVTEQYAKDLWKQMEEFGKYSFNASHAISYSINGYTSMWLKVHYPIEFWAVTFSRASADDYPFYINEIKQSGEIEIKPVDINVSEAQIVSDRENNSMYWALNSVTQLGEKAQEQLMEDRKLNGPYFSFDEFVDRVVTKGSAINKSVIENLIYSGAFDQLENLGDVRDREKLLLRFRDLRRIKIDATKDSYSIAKTTGKVCERWWWQLQQKKISGYGFFDYKDLIKKYLYKTTNNDQYNTIYDGNDLKQELPNAGKRVSVGGYCIDVIVKRCKQGLFATLMLENNYEFIEVTVFSDIYDQYSEFIDSLKKSIVLLNGIATWNNYRDKNIVQTTEETYFVKLSVDDVVE